MHEQQIEPLQQIKNIETVRVLKKAALAHRHLAELKGEANTIPNKAILVSTLTLQEAKDSSEIENIVTTHDEMYKASLFQDHNTNPAVKEVSDYANALNFGYNLVKNNKMLTNRHINQIQEIIEKNNADFRKLPGTKIENKTTGEVLHTPPQSYDEIVLLMTCLEEFINNDDLSDIDPLIKMAMIHYQFESIHPFYDGNGRTGRIINILYLVLKELLDIPILYLSRYIIQNKSDYYGLLQSTRDTGDWEPWVIFILEAVRQTSIQTINTIREIKRIMIDYKHRIRETLPKIYSQDLINNLFKHPYTKIALLQDDLKVSRKTATRYLHQLTEKGFLTKLKVGRSNYYVNQPLYNLFERS